MIKLSDRLEKIYDLIGPGERVADIGADHALLPIALYARGRTRALILSDARPGPLEKTRANLKRRLPGALFDVRLGDGLAPYARGEVDVAVIAGMGGRIIADILSADAEKARSFGRYILQPRNAADKLRARLAALGFVVLDEVLATEGRFICEILCAAPAGAGAAKVLAQAEAADAEAPAGAVAPVWVEAPVWADASAVAPAGGASAPPEALRRAEAILTAGGLAAEISPLLFRRADPLLAVWLERKLEAAEAVSARLAAAGAGKDALLAASRARAFSLRALLDILRTRDGADARAQNEGTAARQPRGGECGGGREGNAD
ncbi:MAG: class I SAM-dependent methyltransferase [Clostridiales Family XIII bacterium]|jgi:tRNA (adenine22-N1)-methyltransferase|nr:class I SAM-dependent methyltransferase [Clostridiales Family XIII bacterium]